MASSSSSFASDSQYCRRWKYDVFLSFSGWDIGKTFVGHLYEGLKNKGIFAFQDDKRLEQGDSISEELLKAVEESQVALIVFSRNYAASSWCLDELVKIMECKEKNGQKVIPVFYDVDPSDVRSQKYSFGEAFYRHESRYKDDVEGMQKVQAWRIALTAAAELKGCYIRDRTESECIRELIDNVSSILYKTSSSYLQDIVGIDTHLKKHYIKRDQHISMASSSSSFASDSQYCPRWKYDVFVSFRGIDTGKTFVGHLYEGLKNRGIFAFQDDKWLAQGNSIPEELLKAIEESQVAIIAFSTNYAASRWCLTELVKIMECKVENGQLVIPVFYDVDPSEVRHQSNSFGEAFDRHELRYKDDVVAMQKVQAWRTALTAAANLRGYDIGRWTESECIRELVDYVSSILCKTSSSYLQDIVGIDTHLEKHYIKRDQHISMASSSSSSFANDSQNCPRWKYNVFINFRGEDTRKTFTSHLYESLKNRGILAFQEDKWLAQGNSIPEELLKAIEESQVAIIVFSSNYAASSWCLTELVKIMECKVENEQIVIPVFYDVGPSEVRNQKTRFAEAFCRHELRYKDDAEGMQKVQAWRTALTAAANLPGYDIHYWTEPECIQKLVDNVSSKLCKTSLSNLQDIVGIDTHLEKVKSLLEMEINDVRILGIWGMGGVGKTTIARAIFDTLSPQFQSASFLADVKEINTNEMHYLQNNLLSELLREDKKYVNNKEEGKRLMAHRLRFMKVLIVLDDINHHDHLECLAGDLCWFGSGSRIIATTRNKQIIGKNNEVYEVTTLLEHDSIQLFNHYAFKDEAPDEHIKKLALEVVSHAKGLPLALKVWGSLLHRKGLTQWRRTIYKIKENYSSEIFEKLKISYDGLEPKEQEIFLDIACFFRGDEKKKVMQILESCDFEAEYGLDVLIQNSLVLLTEDDMIEMHDLIQDMGKYIMEIQKDAGVCSRIWDYDYFEEVMVNNRGTEAVQVIWFCYDKNICFRKEAMKNMEILRILHVWSQDCSPCHDGSIEYLPNNLRWFVWNHFPWESLPENFEPKRLVHLQLPFSSLHHLWRGIKQLPSLQRLELRGSKSLKKTPDFTGMPNLEYLDLSECRSLEEVHHSLRCSRKLIELNLNYCESLKRFPYVNVESLESLSVDYCSSLEKFPEFIGRMKPELEIKMSCSGIRELPSSIIHLQAHLTELYLSDMKNLVALPSSIRKLKDLVKLDVSFCSKLESLPEEIGDLENLKELHAVDTLISQPPSSIIWLNKLKVLTFAKSKSEDTPVCFVFPQVNEGLLSLEYLDLSSCNLIDGGLPEDIGSLSSLRELNLTGNNFEHLPRRIAQLSALRSLDLSDCNKLKQFPGITEMPNLDTLNLGYCNLTDGGLPEDIGSLSSLKELNLSGNNFEHLPRSIAQLGALRSLYLSACKRLTQLPEFPQQLDIIDADWSSDSICNSLFQNISSLQRGISASHSLSLRVFESWALNIPSWFHHQGMDTSVSVNLPENWYVSDNFLGFAVCSFGKLIDITAHLIPLCDDGMSLMTKEFTLSNHSEEIHLEQYAIHFFLVPLAGLWDASNANGKTPNDYGHFRLFFTGEKKFGVRLLYKDEPELHIEQI